MGCHDLHQEPRSAAGGRYGGTVSRRGAVARQGQRSVVKEHFSVDGTLLEAWASPKSFRPKDGPGEPPGPGCNGERDFHGERRRNGTHASTTYPDAGLFR